MNIELFVKGMHFMCHLYEKHDFQITENMVLNSEK